MKNPVHANIARNNFDHCKTCMKRFRQEDSCIGDSFFFTSTGQVCWHEYVAPCKLIFASWTKSLDIFIFLFHVQNYGKNFIHLSLIYLYKFSIKFFPFDVLEVSSFFQSKISSLYVLRWLWDDKPRLTCKK